MKMFRVTSREYARKTQKQAKKIHEKTLGDVLIETAKKIKG